MSRIPYETIAPQAAKLLDKVIEAFETIGPTEDVLAMYQSYKDYLEACGWTAQEFRNEQITRIDADWDDPKQN